MPAIDRAYVALALLLLVLGEALGFYVGASGNTTYRALHITMVLPGFVTLAIYGVLFRLWPAMQTGALAAAQFWIGALSTLGLVVGTYHFTVSGGSIAIVAPSSLAAILGALLLLWLFWTRSRAA